MTECPEPLTYANSMYSLDEHNPYEEGSYAIYSCGPGHQMEGNADNIVHVCQQNEDGLVYSWQGPPVTCTGKYTFFMITIVADLVKS